MNLELKSSELQSFFSFFYKESFLFQIDKIVFIS